MSDPHDDSSEFGLVSRTLGGLPIVNLMLDRLGLAALLAGALPGGDARLKLAPAAAIRLVITNLVLGREPLYGLGEWAGRHDPALLGLSSDDLAVLNDDRVGRALEALFDADRASLLTTVVLRAISEFSIDTNQLHNDSTSISVHGAYRGAVGTERGGKPTPVITFGHSKDHRPDLKQLVWILTVSADGAVPLAYRLADGNTSDDPTHVPTWDGLVELLGRTDFLYVADSKLCSRAAMGHIAGRGGRFVTVLPRSRAEDGAFRDCRPTPRPGPKPPAGRARRRSRTRSTPPPRRHCPRPRATASPGCTPPPRPPATPPPDRPASKPASPRSKHSTPNSPARGAGSRPASRSNRPPPPHWRRHPRRPVGHRHRHRDHRQDVQAGTTRPARTRDELPGDHHQPLHPGRRHRPGPRRLRRRQRRLLPTDHQRPQPVRRPSPRRLPLPAQPRTPPPPTQERPRRRTRCC